MKQLSNSAQKQLIKFLNSRNPEHFTKSLYEECHIGLDCFIAHFNREGFINARFLGSISDLKQTKLYICKATEGNVKLLESLTRFIEESERVYEVNQRGHLGITSMWRNGQDPMEVLGTWW